MHIYVDCLENIKISRKVSRKLLRLFFFLPYSTLLEFIIVVDMVKCFLLLLNESKLYIIIFSIKFDLILNERNLGE